MSERIEDSDSLARFFRPSVGEQTRDQIDRLPPGLVDGGLVFGCQAVCNNELDCAE